MKINFFFLFVALVFITNAYSKNIVLKATGYYDSELSTIVYNKYIFIKNGKIQKISNSLDFKNYQLIDLGASFLIPGFFDSHSHLFFTQEKGEKSFNEALLREIKLDEKFRIDRARVYLDQYLKHGFTSVIDLGNSGNFLDVKLRDEVRGNENFPELFISGPGIASLKAQFDKNISKEYVSREYNILEKREDVDKLLQIYISKNVDNLKIYLDNSPGEGEFDLAVLKKILNNPNINKFKKITFHSIIPPRKDDPIFDRIKNIEHYYYDINTNFKNVLYITATDLNRASLEEFNYFWAPGFKINAQRLKRLIQLKKIQIIFGPDFYFNDAKNAKFDRVKYVLDSIDSFKNAGMSSEQILNSLTINPARAMNLQKRLGNIKVGAMANIVAVGANPILNIDSIKNVNFVMNKGKLIFKN